MNVAIIASSVKVDNVKVGAHVSVDLPGISFATTDVGGAGVMGTIAVPTMGQVESTEMAIHTRGLDAGARALYAPGKHRIELLTAQQVFAPNTNDKAVAGKIYVEGRFKSADGGSVEKPNPVEGSVTYEVTRMQEFVDGREVLCVDKENFIYRVNGVDYMAEVRAAVQ
ncbi:MAG: phage major tail tube protein [Oscillospiraceae bacterium]|nr:phage major tail tube protein [Oscillospiraceae bacterium]